jgi:hypothetical protein
VKSQDQPTLWDEPRIEIQEEESILTEEEFQKGAPGEHGRWVRVYYKDDYLPTPGQISGRDVYNAWCTAQQAKAKMLRDFYGYHLEADSIERNIWIWNGLGPDTKKQFDQMAEQLMQRCLSQSEVHG